MNDFPSDDRWFDPPEPDEQFVGLEDAPLSGLLREIAQQTDVLSPRELDRLRTAVVGHLREAGCHEVWLEGEEWEKWQAQQAELAHVGKERF